MFCKCRSTVWKDSHKLSNKYGNEEKWIIAELNRIALDQFQKESRGIEHASTGERSYPLFTCIPVPRFLPPMLYTILGIGNGTYSNFKEFITERIEKTSEEELAATNMTLLDEINHDE